MRGAQEGDQVSWTTKPACTAGGNSDPKRTWTFYLSAGTNNVELHTTAEAGLWTLCFQPYGGLVTAIVAKQLLIIPAPTFTPNIGVAGSVTSIVYGGGNVTVGDYISLQPGSCLNAHLARPGPLTNGGEYGRIYRCFKDQCKGLFVGDTNVLMTGATAPGKPILGLVRALDPDRDCDRPCLSRVRA